MDEIDEYIGKIVMLHISINGQSLFYTAKIMSSKGSFVTFLDREGKRFTYSKDVVKGLKLEGDI